MSVVDCPTDFSELLSREQAAKMLGVETHTLAVWATTGRYSLPFYRVGKFAKYRRADIEQWLAGRRVGDSE
jgi:excisionase family DNA binding protein